MSARSPGRSSARSAGRGNGFPRRAFSVYQTAMRQAIASQHGLAQSDRLELCACEGCGTPYLLTSLWQPISEEGAIACPRCGTEAVSWNGARGYVAYWQRAATRPPAARTAPAAAAPAPRSPARAS
jgi:uncharacterized Zn-finger protein